MTSLNQHPESAEAANKALDAALRALHREVLDEPVPPTLQDAALRLEALQQQKDHRWQWSGMAAGVLLAFGLGWLSHGQLARQADPSVLLAKGTAAQAFVQQARFAHAVYLPEKRHPVEVAAADQAHLVQWLSKRLDRPLKVPQLEDQGFELLGGRLLPGETGARAQFMFQNGQGLRITLYLGAIDKAEQKSDLQSTTFRFEPNGSVPSFYWAEQGFAYALSGQVDKATLMALANSVYRQIN